MLLGRLAEQELILPYFGVAMLADNWPDEYIVRSTPAPTTTAWTMKGSLMATSTPLPISTLGERELYYRLPDTRDNMLWGATASSVRWRCSGFQTLHGVVQTQMVMLSVWCTPDIGGGSTSTRNIMCAGVSTG